MTNRNEPTAGAAAPAGAAPPRLRNPSASHPGDRPLARNEAATNANLPIEVGCAPERP